LVGWSEIDKYAIQAHNALFPQWSERNYGDISKIDWSSVPDFDLFTYSSPCQDFSNAGLQRGAEEGSGTRSSLLWECRRAIVAKRPKYLLFENVAAVVSKKFMPLFTKWVAELDSYGYENFWELMNAKDFGIPQNRKRLFMVSILRDGIEPYPAYEFPKPFPLELRLKHILEANVDEKYYLSDKAIEGFTAHNDKHNAKGTGFIWRPKDISENGGGYANCIRANSALNATDNTIIDNSSI
jgi:DNA (cytosine-5)-methyltransferase 1